MVNEKVIYFFRGNLQSHVDLYKTCVDLVKNDVDITMLTFMTPKTYNEQIGLVNKYRAEGIKIYSVYKWANRLAVILYFTYLCLKYKKVVVHLRKQPVMIFNLLRKITFGRLKYLIDIEGDFVAEIDYLSNPKNKYKNGFYDTAIKGMKVNAQALENEFKNADGVLVATNEMKALFEERYNITDKSKLSILPTVFDSDNFYFDPKLRKEKRKKLGFEGKTVMVFAGNVHYSWQNIKRSLEVFQLLKEKCGVKNLHFMILTRIVDYPIIQEFASDLGVNPVEYTLTNVPHNEINSIFNAADIGILLREEHLLNKVVSTGKMGEYLATGLSIITSKHIGHYSAAMEKANIGVLLDDIYNDSELISKTNGLLFSDIKRENVSRWATQIFSAELYKDNYLQALRRV